MSNFERRTASEKVEFRKEGNSLVAVGYAARFNTLSANLGGFVEQIAPGAFTKTVQEADIRGLFNHDPSLVLGRNGSGTLRLEEDNVGLRYEIDLPDTSVGRDVAVLLERGDVSGSSFGFRAIEDEWGETDKGFALRTIKVAALRDVGPVTFPAYAEADSALRSLATSLGAEFRSVQEAAEANSLLELIQRSNTEDEELDEKGGQATPTTYRRSLHVF